MRHQTKHLRLVAIFIFLTAALVLLGASIDGKDDPADFWFAQMTDTHQAREEADWRIEGVVDDINGAPMDLAFVAVTGDLTADKTMDDAVMQRLKNSLDKLDAPYRVLPGNHDIIRKDPDPSLKQIEKYFNPHVGAIEHQGVVFLFVNTDPLARAYSVDLYNPLAWTEAQLEKAGNKPVVIFHHEPSVEDYFNNKMHGGWRPEYREAWIKLINRYNVKAVIAGHFHRAEQHWLGDVPLYVAPPVAGYWGRQASYRLYHYQAGRLSFTTQYLDR